MDNYKKTKGKFNGVNEEAFLVLLLDYSTLKMLLGRFYSRIFSVLWTEGKFQVVFSITVRDIYIPFVINENNCSRNANEMHSVFHRNCIAQKPLYRVV